MIHETASENKLTSIVGEIEKRFDSIAEKLEQLISEFQAEYKNAQSVLDKNSDSKSSKVNLKKKY